ncbi:MAG: CCA tRNA nucleotidyltransferase [Alphaproteobacteria bacterium]|nr:CCA tRNA nucleotidyltransferase [Alphaproteobacteria bacterium]
MKKLTAGWLKLPGLQRLFTLFHEEGATLRLVGGSVRDGLLGLPTNDIDLAVDRPPQWVQDILVKNHIKAIPTGFDHGTITAVLDKQTYQITTLRLDIKTFGRKAEVAFTEDWVRDAQRRDFTINALYADKEGNLFDPVGGLEDLENRCLQFIGNPSQRIKEDYLRILRFFRFSARFGKEPYSQEGLEACREFASHLPHLARERVTDEFLQILELPAPLYALEVMKETGVLPYIFHPKVWEDFKTLLLLEKTMGMAPDPLLRLASFHPLLSELKSHLRLSKVQITKLSFLLREHTPITIGSYKHFAYLWGKEHTFHAAILQTAYHLVSKELSLKEGTVFLEHLQTLLNTAHIPIFPLKGRDLLALHIKPGKSLGELLKAVENWWIFENFTPDKKACIKYLKSLL